MITLRPVSTVARWTESLLALMCSVVLFAAPLAGQSQDRGELPPVVSLPADLQAVLTGYETAWGNRDADALAALFTEDGFVLRPGHPPAVGRASIRAAYEGSGGPLSLKAYAFSVSGDIGYIIGGYSALPTQLEGGKFVLTLRRGPSGSWLITADMDNGN